MYVYFVPVHSVQKVIKKRNSKINGSFIVDFELYIYRAVLVIVSVQYHVYVIFKVP